MWGRLFNRPARPAHPITAYAPRAIVATSAPIAAPRHPGGPQWGTEAGWAPFGQGQAREQQIGAYAGQMLNQYPAMISGVQLDNGLSDSGVGSRWYYPALTAIPNGSLQQTQRPNNVIGSQRYGSIYSGPLGPVNAKAATAAVAAAQVRQSGLAAMGWARGLNLGQGGNG